MITAMLYLASTGWEGHMHDWGGGWWIVMGLMMIVFWGLVAAGIVWLVRYLTTQGGQRREAGALELLDRRLALGEVSVEEYRERRAVLRDEPGTGTAPGKAEEG